MLPATSRARHSQPMAEAPCGGIPGPSNAPLFSPSPHRKPPTMSLDPQCLSGRVAVVVGASSGINLGVAQRLGSLGARLAIVSRTAERIEAAAATLAAEGIDVTAQDRKSVV